MVIYFSLLVALIGLLLYAFSAHPKLSEIGRITYGAGLLAFLLTLPGHTVALLPR